MAGSWEALPFRVRRDGSPGYTPTAEQAAAWEREHSPEMIQRLKDLGVTFVMMHCYKGGGLETERESMAAAVEFSKRCHEAGLHVGAYTYSGAFIWETLFQEIPAAKDWILLDENGKPRTLTEARPTATTGTATIRKPSSSTRRSSGSRSTTSESTWSTWTTTTAGSATMRNRWDGFASIWRRRSRPSN